MCDTLVHVGYFHSLCGTVLLTVHTPTLNLAILTVTSQVSEEKAQTLVMEVKEGDVEISFQLEDARMDRGSSLVVLKVSPISDQDMYLVKLRTAHHAFSLGCSVTCRTLADFYWLQKTLSAHHPHKSVPSLPVRPFVHLASPARVAARLAAFLAAVVGQREYLGDRALHLVLQTSLPVQRIQRNLEGLVDDEVDQQNHLADNRTNSRDGFQQIFGFQSN